MMVLSRHLFDVDSLPSGIKINNQDGGSHRYLS